MSRGGYRPTAGRPRGARDKAPRKRPAPPPEALAQKAFLDACADFVKGGEPYRILRAMADDPDPRVRGWAVEKLLAYGVGTPSGRHPEPPQSLAATFDEASRKLRIAALVEAARGRAERAQAAPPRREISAAPQPLISGAPEAERREVEAVASAEPRSSPGVLELEEKLK